MSSLHKTDKEVIHQDEAEQIEINNIIQDILSKEKGPFYFFDIHTTSSETLPFLTVNDSLLNRNYTVQYPLPIILGIEEYLDGPILSYINELGYVAFGFEAGQHDDMASIENAISFIYLSLVFTECIKEGATNFHKHHDLLAKTTGDHRHFYEIFFRYGIKKNETFEMLKGFYNFQRVKKNQPIAKSNGSLVRAKHNGRIFMPLYQSKGSDGFFAIKKIWNPFLTISSYIRKHRLDRFLTMLPGVSWLDEKKSGLIINEKIVRFFAKEVFHLFGYRQVYLNENHLKMLNREAAARFVEYKNEKWMNS